MIEGRSFTRKRNWNGICFFVKEKPCICKYLGAIPDSKLTFKLHLRKITNKVAKFENLGERLTFRQADLLDVHDDLSCT